MDWPGAGLEQEVEVVAHQAIAEESEREAFVSAGEGGEEGLVIVGAVEDAVAVVAAIDGVVDEAIGGGAGKTRHGLRRSLGGGVLRAQGVLRSDLFGR